MVDVITIEIPNETHRDNVVIALAQSGYKVWTLDESGISFEIGEPLPEDRPVIGQYGHKGEQDGI